MKLKDYMRGVGVGILFSTVILSASYHSSSKAKLTDNEIIELAEQLGMEKVDTTDEIDTNLDNLLSPTLTPAIEGTAENTAEDTVEDTAENTMESSVEESTDETSESTTEPTPEPTVTLTEVPTATPTVTPTPNISESDSIEDTTENSNADTHYYIDIVIEKGMTSETVAKLLEKNGIIEDGKLFNQYLIENDYTKTIRIGEFQLETDSTYDQICDVIIKK